jgi:hypothetical protein
LLIQAIKGLSNAAAFAEGYYISVYLKGFIGLNSSQKMMDLSLFMFIWTHHHLWAQNVNSPHLFGLKKSIDDGHKKFCAFRLF